MLLRRASRASSPGSVTAMKAGAGAVLARQLKRIGRAAIRVPSSSPTWRRPGTRPPWDRSARRPSRSGPGRSCRAHGARDDRGRGRSRGQDSGPRLEPPMPSSTTSFAVLGPNAFERCLVDAAPWPAASQPSHLSSSQPGPESGVARPQPARPAASRPFKPVLDQSLQRLGQARFERARPARPAFRSAFSRSRRSACRRHPRICRCLPTTKMAVTPARLRPRRSASDRIRRSPSISALSDDVVTPWSRNASIVLGGMVLIVSRPIRVST